MIGVAGTWLTAAWQSDAGRVRDNNEDLPLCEPEGGVFGVIDGVGGQAAGEIAAAIARREIMHRLSRPLGTSAERVREAIALANNEIWRASEECPDYEGMTCVLTLALVVDQRLTIGHVGDSRCYKVTPKGIRKLTHDHSPVGEREDAHALTELEAMRHPRRNEVFRDVGGIHRDKDDDAFVDVVEETIEPDAALLLCTDGLTDMVPSASIEHVVRAHAGDPQAVADALVASANDAGGRDNVTVVYAEGPDFAHAVRRVGMPEKRRVASRLWRPIGWMLARRPTWFAAGAVAGVAMALLLASRLGSSAPVGGRTLVVGAGSTYPRIDAAIAAAHPGDVVQIKPGTYAERVVLPEGVDLVAAVAGTATLVRDQAEPGEWLAVAAAGSGTITGLRIESRPDAPIATGIRVSGSDRRIELCDVEGPMARAGIEFAGAEGATVSGCSIRVSQGPGVAVVGGADIHIRHNTFLRPAGSADPALVFKEADRAGVSRNLFVGYGADFVRGLSAAEREALFSSSHNLMSPSQPVPVR